MKFCSNCGRDNADKASFCRECGTRLDAAPEALGREASPSAGPSPEGPAWPDAGGPFQGSQTAPPPPPSEMAGGSYGGSGGSHVNWDWIGEGFRLLFSGGEIMMGMILVAVTSIFFCCIGGMLTGGLAMFQNAAMQTPPNIESFQDILAFFKNQRAVSAAMALKQFAGQIPQMLYLALVGPALIRLIFNKRAGRPASAFDVFKIDLGSSIHFFLIYFMLSLVNGVLGQICCTFPLIIIGNALLIFCLPAVSIDRLTAVDAIRVNFKIISLDIAQFLFFGIALILVSMSGAIACCIGLLVTIPAMTCAIIAAYADSREKVLHT